MPAGNNQNRVIPRIGYTWNHPENGDRIISLIA